MAPTDETNLHYTVAQIRRRHSFLQMNKYTKFYDFVTYKLHKVTN